MYGPPIYKNEKNEKGFKAVKGFFSRYIYIFKLVWETSPFILFVMTFTSIFDGLFPVFGAYVTAQLLGAVASAYNVSQGLITSISSEEALRTIIFWVVLEFGYLILKNLINTVYNAIIII